VAESPVALVLVGTNHRHAPIGVREELAARTHGRDLIEAMAAEDAVLEAVGLSTCNRCEIAMVGADATAMREAAVRRLAVYAHRTPAEIEPLLYTLEGMDVAEHLFAVAGGLDSMVPGEAQILAQIREAYEAAYEWDTTGPVTNRLFHQALEAGKRVRHETAIGEGGASPASVAAELVAERLGAELASAQVLVVGAGRVAELVAANLSARGVGSIAVANRDPDRAAALASRFGGRAVELTELRTAIAAASVVVASTASPEPLIGPGDVPPGRRVLIDLAVPRDIDPAVADVEGVSLHTIDDLESVVSRTISLRHGEADRARAIVAAQSSAFRDWMAALEVVPAITSLRAHAERIRVAELERVRPGDLSPAERDRLDALTQRIVNKLLHRPTVRLKELAAEDESGPYAEAVTELFGLAAGE